MVPQRLTTMRSRARLVVLTAGIVLVGIAGWGGFLAFDRRDIGSGVGLGTIALAAAAGFGVFFAPCSFPMLLTRLTRLGEQRRSQLLGWSTAMGAGVALVFGAIAGMVALGGEGLATALAFDTVPGRVFRLAVAAFLLFLGLRQVGRLGIRMAWLDRVASSAGRRFGSRGSDAPTGFAYGAAYPIVGFG